MARKRSHQGGPVVAPKSVRHALNIGLILFDAGYGGKGLRPETVRWARLLADGEPITLEKAVKMRAWFARHTAAKAESDARKRDAMSPANVAYLLWGGTPAIEWSERAVRLLAR